MTLSLGRRSVLLSLLAVPGALALAACSDSGEQASAPAETPPPAEGGTPPPATPAPPAANVPAPDGTVDMAAVLQPGTLPDKVLGKDDAPVTIVEYASLTCGHCAAFHKNTLPEIKTKYIDTGKARLILREFPFDPRAEAGFMLARCAGDNYFPMVDVLFKQQESWAGVENAKAALLQLSKLAGFTQESFEACLTDQKLLEDVRAMRDRGNKEFKVDSTPTFIINGNVYKGTRSVEEMSAIIDGML